MMQAWIPSKRGLMALISVLAGLVAAWAARQHIQAHIAHIEAAAHVPTVARVVAAYDLAAGTRLEAEYVAVRQIPREWATSDTLAPEDFVALTDKLLIHGVQRGDPLRTTSMAQEKPSPLSSRVSAGRRAITIPVDDINSLSGMLQAGDLIDLYVSFEHHGRQVTAPLLQGVLVLATGRTGKDEGEASAAFSTITLDADPEDAVKLVAARQVGNITAILRHHRDGDTDAVIASGDLASLLGMAAPSSQAERVVPVLYGDRSGNTEGNVIDEEAIPFVPTPGFFKAAAPSVVSSSRKTQAEPNIVKQSQPVLP
jgi:pilus assembly protein CpaB